MEQSEIVNQKDKLSQQSLVNAAVPDFLIKTYQMLEENKHHEKVSWNKDGTMIIIKKPLEFADEVLPLYFKHNNLASFIRQLNNYSFRKMKSKEYEYCFYHEMFCRGRKDLLKSIKRKKSPRSKGSKAHQKHSNAQRRTQATKNKNAAALAEQPTKKVHVDEETQAANAELNEQIAQLTRANEQLRDELLKRQAQDRSLRYIISVLTNYYGAENVQNILKLTESLQAQDLNGGEAKSNGFQFFENSPNEPILPAPTQGNMAPEINPREFIDYENYGNIDRAETGFHHDNIMHAEGLETADNNSGTPSPYFQGEHHNIKDGVNPNNVQQETDYFRKILSGTSFPFTNFLNTN